MNASPVWLEELARGVATRDGRGERPGPRWGEPRFSRRRVVGTAASTVVAASALRFVSPAAAQAPQCLSPCLKSAADGYAEGLRRNRRGFERRMADLQNALDDLTAAKRRAKSARKRAAIQRQINANVNKQLGILDTWRDYQGESEDSMADKQRKCKSDAQCGDPEKYPGGQAPPGSGSGQCGDPAAACGDLCCSSGSRCCSSCKTCCVDVVSCGACCPG